MSAGSTQGKGGGGRGGVGGSERLRGPGRNPGRAATIILGRGAHARAKWQTMDDTPVANSAPSTTGSPGRGVPPRPARVGIIAAVAANGVIGARNAMPWSLPGDLRHFRSLTTGHRVVMGRKTWESLGKPLRDRENVIVTRDAAFRAPAGCVVARTFGQALENPGLPLPVFCIGGAQLYAEALPRADRLYLTEIDATFEGDIRMPDIRFDEWVELSRRDEVDPATGIHYAFVEYSRL